MQPITPYLLEEFAERHRADFDLHEPRPELWEVLEKQLEAAGAGKADQPHLRVLAEPLMVAVALAAAPAHPQPKLRGQLPWQRYGIAAALALLLVAAGLGEVWKSRQSEQAAQALASTSQPVTGADAALYLDPEASALPASQGGPNGNARLDTAVHGMERYYAAQLTDRQAQLSQLAPENVAEWSRELVSLDSSYQQLKHELTQHPQPEVVLTAMNRNLQTRLDILDQQLALRGADQLAQSTGGEYSLADSRSLADNMAPTNAH